MSAVEWAVPGTPSFTAFTHWIDSLREASADEGSVRSGRLRAAKEAGFPEARWIREEELRAAVIPTDALQRLQACYGAARASHERRLEMLTKGWTRASRGWTWRAPIHPQSPSRSGVAGQRTLPYRRVGLCLDARGRHAVRRLLEAGAAARVAGVEECVVIVSPAAPWEIPPMLLAAARDIGARTVVQIGAEEGASLLAHGCDAMDPVEAAFALGHREAEGALRLLFPCQNPGGARVGVCLILEPASEASASCWAETLDWFGAAGSLLVTNSMDVGENFVLSAGQGSESAERPWAVVVESPDAAIAVVERVRPEIATLFAPDAERLSLGMERPRRILIRPRGIEGAFFPQVTDFLHTQTVLAPTALDDDLADGISFEPA